MKMEEKEIRKESYHLRDYQKDCLSAIYNRYKTGIRRQLTCLPTGSGKTVIFSEFPKFFKMKKQMLVLAHRAELLDQARAKLHHANPDLRIEIEQAGRNADPDCDVVVASVPTLGRKGAKRLKHLDPDRFFLIVVDEAHHATADTYTRILKYLGVFEKDTRKLLVGFTATPKRGDGEGLDKVFQEIVFSRSLPEMIDSGYLSPVAGYRVETEIDLSRVRTRMGDFVVSHLSRAVNVEYRNDIIIDVYKKYLEGKQTLCFCVDVAHAHSIAKAFERAGIRAASVTGDMDMTSRSKTLEDFRTERIKLLANCMVLTEGYDEPSVQGIILARPTKSILLYTQMIGRGTRLHPGKENVTVVDIVDATREHSLTTLPGLFGLSNDFDLEGHTTDEPQKAMDWVEVNRPWVPVDRATSLSDLKYRCRKIDLFDLQTPHEISRYAEYAWAGTAKTGYRLGLTLGNAILLSPTILDSWEVNLRHKGKMRLIKSTKSIQTAIMAAEEYVKDHFPDLLKLVHRESRWRRSPASEKQINLLKNKGIEIPKGLTKGQASYLIGMLARD
ncbi:MAG: DEAD/DEAH box helicase [Deltaproteobacteria bacterium]|nr:DEAD/DEAH box helicase [Deltaproteobacteria bacterium]